MKRDQGEGQRSHIGHQRASRERGITRGEGGSNSDRQREGREADRHTEGEKGRGRSTIAGRGGKVKGGIKRRKRGDRQRRVDTEGKRRKAKTKRHREGEMRELILQSIEKMIGGKRGKVWR